MSTSKHINLLCVIAVILALLIGLLFVHGEGLGIQIKDQTAGYESRLFDTSKVHTIDILVEDWDAFLATALLEEYSACNVIIDGEVFSNVGLRSKGNMSLTTITAENSQRFSFKLEFDHYDSTNQYYGLDKLSLSSMIQDNTMMKDYLTYRMMNEFGVPAPLCSFVYITINGEEWGLYLAAEAVEESFLMRNYGRNHGELYKPNYIGMGGGLGDGQELDFEDFADSEAPENMPPDGSGSAMMPGINDTTLQYVDDQIINYSSIFNNAKTDVTLADKQRLIASLKALSSYEVLESVLDADQVIRYFVVHNYVVNADSYTGSMVHNYYLYEDSGRLSMIPWDYNLAFGTFHGTDAARMLSDDIDAPLCVTGSGRPMIDWIFSSEEYTALYHEYFQEFLDTVDIDAIIDQAQTLISPYVKKDPTKFCTYEEFDKGVETLSAFCQLRTRSIADQLAGGDGAVDASSINLFDMGALDNSLGEEVPSPDMSSPPSNSDAEIQNMQPIQGGTMQEGLVPPDQVGIGAGPTDNQWILGISAASLAAGLLFVIKFRR